jgi:hypothetical protein
VCSTVFSVEDLKVGRLERGSGTGVLVYPVGVGMVAREELVWKTVVRSVCQIQANPWRKVAQGAAV